MVGPDLPYDFAKIEKFQNFSDHSKIFFCFTIHEKLNKSCSLDFFLLLKKKILVQKKFLKKKNCWWDPTWRISIHCDFDSLGGPLSPCDSHWLRSEPFTQIRSRTLCSTKNSFDLLVFYGYKITNRAWMQLAARVRC